VDDGSRTVEDALHSIARMTEAGVRGIITTPHLNASRVSAPGFGQLMDFIDRKGKVMGATMVAHGAGDLIMPLVLAKTHGLSLSQVANTIFPYPTMVEGLKRASGEYMRSRLDTASGRTLKRVIKWLK